MKPTLPYSRFNVNMVMTIDQMDVPTESTPFFCRLWKRFANHVVVKPSIFLPPIQIYNSVKAANSVASRKHSCLPDLSFLTLSVS